MIIPVRCFTCNTVVGNKWQKYQTHLANGTTAKEALTQLGLHRICCRRMLLTHVELIDTVLAYQHPHDEHAAVSVRKRKTMQ